MTSISPFWRGDQPLVLASGSAARRALLEAIGIPLEILRIDLDEAVLAKQLLTSGASPKIIAQELAAAKGAAAARLMPDRILLAADQTADHDGRLMMKAADPAEARGQLGALAGSSHHLHSAAILHHGEKILWSGVASARLVMRPFSEEFLDLYLQTMGDEVTKTVGGYQLEKLGPHLFAQIEGEHATILGLPLLDLLEALRQQGLLAA